MKIVSLVVKLFLYFSMIIEVFALKNDLRANDACNIPLKILIQEGTKSS